MVLCSVATIGYSQDSAVRDSLLQKKRKTQVELVGEQRVKDSLQSVQDSIIRSNAVIKTKINYKAKKYIRINRIDKTITLYDNAESTYGDMAIKGGIVTMNYQTNVIHSGRIQDSLGVLNQNPNFKQGGDIIEPDSISFNYKNKKAFIWNSITKQKDGSYIHSEKLKKVNDSVYYMNESKVTTSENLKDPEYYFRIRKSKMVPGKKMITRSANMYVANVPTPLWIPFAYFPLSSEGSSGLLMPTFGQGGDRGYFLQNGGYYIAFGDHVDVSITGDYYSNSSYGLRFMSSYKKRYKYSGGINLRYETLVQGERGFKSYGKSSIYNIQWNHRSDPKFAPNSSFSASVNLGSSSYYRQSLNQLNTPNFLNNNLTSSINYSKTFPAYPSVRTSVSMNHSQNNNTKTVNMTLPTLQASMERIYPFAPKNGSKKGLIKNINFQYNLNARHTLATYDSLMFTKRMFEKAKSGAQHKIPINTNFKVFKYFSINMGGSYEDNWTFQTVKYRDYDPETGKAKKDTLKNFDRFGKYSFSTSIGTTIYGMFPFGSDRKIQGIRHTMRPSVSLSHTPDQKKLYDSYISNKEGTLKEYTRFETGLYGRPLKKSNTTINLQLNNNFEAKITERDTTKIEPRKLTLLNTLNFSASYNATADSLHWSPINVRASTNILKNKLSINAGLTLDPYAISATGVRYNKPNIKNGGSLFRLPNANVNLSYSISSDDFEKLKGKRSSSGLTFKSNNRNIGNLNSGGRPDGLFGRAIQMGNHRPGSGNSKGVSDDDKPYYNYKIPWKISLSQSLRYNNANRQDKFEANSIMFSGGFEPAPRWAITFNSGYDFDRKGFTYTQINFEKDLKSWRMSFSWTPLSDTPTWYFFIGIKSSIFRDIKWEERGKPDRIL